MWEKTEWDEVEEEFENSEEEKVVERVKDRRRRGKFALSKSG